VLADIALEDDGDGAGVQLELRREEARRARRP
jgi:hypothetical protein